VLLASEKARFESFALGESGFAFGPTLHRYADVVSLRLDRVVTTQYAYFMKTGNCEEAQMEARMLDGSSVKLGFKESRLLAGGNNSKAEWIRKLVDVYLQLAGKTFQFRAAPYEQQLKEFGFFLVGSSRFTPSEKSIVCRGQRFLVGRDEFLRSYGVIEPVPAERSTLWRAKRKFLEETFSFLIPRIETATNSDVIFWLLKEHFGLTWTSGSET
jgi:hypothetical protein